MILLKKLFNLVEKHERKRLYFFFIALIIFSLLESISIALIIPYIDIVTSYNDGIQNEFLKKLIDFFSIPDKGIEFLYIATFFLGVIFLLKVISQIIVERLTATIPYDIFLVNSKKLFFKYSVLDWPSFTKRNSNGLIKNLSRTNESASYIFVAFMHFLTALMVTIVLVFVMFFYNFFSTLFLLAFFGLVAFILFFSLKNIQNQAGIIKEKSTEDMYRTASEAMLSMREIRAGGKFQFFFNRFISSVQSYSSALKDTTFYPPLPGIFIEFLSVILLLSFVAIVVTNDSNATNIIQWLIFYAAAGRRLLPAISHIVTYRMILKNLEPSVDVMIEETRSNWYSLSQINQKIETNRKNPKSITHFNNIELKNITFGYQFEGKNLDDISFNITKGVNLGIVGTSGSGKSTLVDLLIGLIEADEGHCYIDGKKLTSSKDLKNIFGYVPQMLTVLDDSIKRNITLTSDDHDIDIKRLNSVIELSQLSEFINELDEGIDTYIGERGVMLSGGQRQRIIIARALYADHEFIIFDEATSSLDNITEKLIKETVRNISTKKTIITVAHKLDLVKDYDHIILMQKGKIVCQGKHLDLKESCESYRKLLLIED